MGQKVILAGEERPAGLDVGTSHNRTGLDMETVGDPDPKSCPCMVSG